MRAKKIVEGADAIMPENSLRYRQFKLSIVLLHVRLGWCGNMLPLEYFENAISCVLRHIYSKTLP